MNLASDPIPEEWRTRVASFAHVVQALRQHCRPATEDIKAEQRLGQIKQQADVTTFYNAFLKAAVSSGFNPDEKGTVKMFKEALSSSIDPKIRKEGMTSLRMKMINVRKPTLQEVYDA